MNLLRSDPVGKVGVDWGGSSFRAYLFDDGLELVEVRSAEMGIKLIASDDFEGVLKAQIGDWLEPGTNVVLSGMITSRSGWQETPYISAPTALSRLAFRAKKIPMDDCILWFLPGLCIESPTPDVIRGEELQLLGAIQTYQPNSVVLPGTHSKWVSLEKDTIVNFTTIITGELFELLRHHSLIGQLAPNSEPSDQAFERGVFTGFESTAILADLFRCRSAVLLDQMKLEEIHSYLSGLLIGHEIQVGTTKLIDTVKPIVIVGSDALSRLYHQALFLLKYESVRADPNVTAVGFQSLFSSLEL